MANASVAAGNVAVLDHVLWRRLAEAATAEEFCDGWLGLLTHMIGGVRGGLVVLGRSRTGSFAPVASWPEGSNSAATLAEIAKRTIEERRGVLRRADPGPSEADGYRLAYPVWTGEELSGACALEISPRPQAELQSAMRQLQWGIAWVQNWVLRETTDSGPASESRLSGALELTGLVLEHSRFRAAATALVTELATVARCDRVSIGFLERRQVKVRALSHSAQFGKQMNLIRSIGAAMTESIDQQAVLLHPEPDGNVHEVLHAHGELARNHDSRAICTVPFVGPDGDALGALTLERTEAEPFDRDTVELCDTLAALTGPILEDKRCNDRLLVVKAWDSLRSLVRKLVGPRHAALKLAVAGMLGLTLFFALATGRYRVPARTVLEGEVQRVVAAPFSGFITDAPVRAGDVVEQGQPMCRLDDRDLRLEYSRWSSEREQHLAEHRRALAEGDAAAVNVLAKKMKQAEAQIALVEEQIDRSSISAPFDGLVVSGDLSQSLGAPVEAGQVLFEVAPLREYRLSLRVDERDIRDIRVGQTGEVILAALPGSRFPFTITRITPVSVSEEGQNLFTVEASLDEPHDMLRPGMEGFGKVEVDRRKLIWIWTHDLVDWVRLRIWSWLP